MHYFALVSNAQDGDIGVLHLDANTGELTPVARHTAAPKVAPLVLSADHQTVIAGTRGKQPSMMAFSIDAATGKLTHQDSVVTASSKAYLSGDKAGRFIFGASYGDHILSVYARRQEGPPLQVIDGIHHAHCVIISPDDRFAYVTALGSDQIFAFEIQATADAAPLTPIGITVLETGFGPRHMRFSPSGDHLYVLSELNARIAVFARNVESGALTLLTVTARHEALSHLQDGVARPSNPSAPQPDPARLAQSVWAADIQVHPSGRFIYASERTTSQLFIYSVSEDGSALRAEGVVPTEQQPRGFRIDPKGTFLIACGEKSSQISAYRIDPSNGSLTLTSRAPGGWGANWVEIIQQALPEDVSQSAKS